MNLQNYIYDNNIKQLQISSGIVNNNLSFLNNIKYHEYENNVENTLFVGMYTHTDYNIIKSHKGNKWILWTGKDIDITNKSRIHHINTLGTYKINGHICLQSNIYDRLLYLNLNPILIDFKLTLINQNKFVFIISSYNNSLWYLKNLDSIKHQTYKNWRVIYVDDKSNDNTYDLVNKYINDNKLNNKIKLIKNDKNYKQGYSRYIAFKECDDNEICCLLDGDDWLYDNSVLEKLNNLYNKNDISITYGKYRYFENNKLKNSSGFQSYPETIIENNSYQHYSTWVACHMRTGYAQLFKSYPYEYLLDFNDELISASTDINEMMWILCNSDGKHMNTGFLTYIYNKDASLLNENSYYNKELNKKTELYRNEIMYYISLNDLKRYEKKETILIFTDLKCYDKRLQDFCDLIKFKFKIIFKNELVQGINDIKINIDHILFYDYKNINTELVNKLKDYCSDIKSNKKYNDLELFDENDINSNLNNINILFNHDLTYIKNKLIIFVPYCDVYYEFIIECLNSIENQKYDNYEVIIVNDGGKKIDLVNKYIENKTNYKIINCDVNHGPAHSKWAFYDYIQKNINNYNYNDICIIIDGDDTINNNTFNIINNTYNNYKCWTTYGNATGEFCNLDDYNMPDGNIRLQKWKYTHPRSFKIFLANYLSEDDFKYNNKWLTKGTDRPIVYNNLELSGKERTKFIDKILYNYRTHDNCSYKTVESKYKLEQIDYLNNKQPKIKLEEDIDIIMCSWKRENNLIKIIECLNKQTVANKIIFHIINNNKDNIEYIDSILENLKSSIKINIKHYDNLYFGFQRFIYIKDFIYKKKNSNYVIIIDDDQTFESDWVEKLYNLRQPKTYTCWYGKIFDKKNINYWYPYFGMPYLLKNNKQTNLNKFHYGGTGGSIIDINIFNEKSYLWKIPDDIPTSIYNIEDLWLSFIITYYYDWNINRSYLPIIEIDYKESLNKALYKDLKDNKSVILEYLQNKYNWIM